MPVLLKEIRDKLVSTYPRVRERTKFGSFDYSLQRGENHTNVPLFLVWLLLRDSKGTSYVTILEMPVENGVPPVTVRLRWSRLS